MTTAEYAVGTHAATAFVSAGFQHSPANRGFLSLCSAFVGELDWGAVLVWNLAPAGLGNIIGGGIAVAVLLSWPMRASNLHPAWRVAGCPAGTGERCEGAPLENIMRKPSKGTSGGGERVPGVYPISTRGGRMSRIPAHTLDNVPDQSRDTLAGLAKKVGKVLNIHAGMAHSPVVMVAHKGVGDAIASHGTLDARTRETIALAVANEDGCHYCESVRTLLGKAAGLTVEQTLAIRIDTIDFDDKLAAIGAIAAVVREAAGNTGTVSDVTWKQALEAGWTEQELTETFAHLAANLFTNYFNHYAETDLDLPEAPALAS